tara:strand:- start:1612 stop:1971 length:360 start_codon:yes stop_codon:yes gene_type:complete
MARNNKGLHEFTVQEANNFDAYTDWNYEVLDMSGTDTATYITEANPAKKIVLYVVPGAATTLEAADVLSLTINGKGGSSVIDIDAGDLPFTLTGVLMTSLSVATSDGTAGDTVSLLSFH